MVNFIAQSNQEFYTKNKQLSCLAFKLYIQFLSKATGNMEYKI